MAATEDVPPPRRSDDPIGVLIVDDHLVFRQAAREVVEATPHFELLGEASSGEHALAAVEELHPDLVLLDVRLPGIDGIAVAKRISAAHPESVIVLISVEEPANIPLAARCCGAAELIRKQDFSPAVLRRVWMTHGCDP